MLQFKTDASTILNNVTYFKRTEIHNSLYSLKLSAAVLTVHAEALLNASPLSCEAPITKFDQKANPNSSFHTFGKTLAKIYNNCQY